MASQEELDRAKELNEIESQRRGISEENLDNLRSASNVLQDQLTFLKFEKTERSEIRSITKDLNKIASSNYSLTLKELGTQKTNDKLGKDRESVTKRINSLLNLRKSLSERGVKINQDLAISIRNQVEEAIALRTELKQIEIESDNISKNFAVKGFAVAEDIVGAIPGLRQFKKSFSDASDSAREVAAAGKGSSKAFSAGAKSLGSAAKAALPLLILNTLVKTFLSLDKQSGEVAKSLGISYDEAIGLSEELSQAADFTDSLFINSTNLLNAQVQISQVLGTNVKLNQELLKSQVELTKQAGYSVETATLLSTLSLATGNTTEDITKNFLGQTVALNAQNKVQVNSKQLLESISKTSKGTLATFADQPKELAKAAFQARKLGLEISTLESIADGLLDIESSLTAEFEAEVITGRQLNLERARGFALTNNMAGVGREIEAQGFTLKGFTEATRIEQDALAKAVGLSRDQLGESLILQKGLAAAGADDAEAARKKYEEYKAIGGEQYAINELGNTEFARQLASVSAQEKFVEITNKLRDAFVSIAGPVLQIVGPIVDTLAPVLTGIANTVSFIVKSFQKLVGVFTGSNEQLGKMEAFVGSIAATYALIKGYALATQVIEGVKLGYKATQSILDQKSLAMSSASLTKSVGNAIFNAISSLSKIPFVGVALGLAAAATIGTMAYKYTQGNDVMSPGGYGSRTLMGPEGTIALNNKDTVIAGTNLFPKDKESRNTSSTVQIDYDRLADVIAMGAEKGTSRANITTNLDGSKVSNRIQAPLAMNTRKYSV